MMDAKSRKQNVQYVKNTGLQISASETDTNSGVRTPQSGNRKPAGLSTRRGKSRGSRQYSDTRLSQQKQTEESNLRNPNSSNEHHIQHSGSRWNPSHDTFQRVPQKVYLIPFQKLSELVKKNPSEVLLTILDKRSGILSRVEQNKLPQNLLAYLFIALGIACTADMHKNIVDLINVVCGSKNSILLHVQQYLLWLQRQETLEEFHLDSLLNIVVLLQKFQLILPSSSSDLISILLPLLKSTTEKCLKAHDDSYVMVTEKIKEMDEQNQFFLDHHNLLEIKRESKKEKLHALEPLESFRSIPVLPTKDDIDSPCTFLRPNIVKGKYKDTEHYLDVQFRLLREDYIKPLRDGISEYRSLKNIGKSVKNCKDVRVYNNAFIVGEEFLNGHLLHFIYFSDTFFARINWDRSKRLLTGSLLCLSSDDFQTMLFATVVHRDIEELRKGILLIEFQEINEHVLNLNDSINFVVIETTAYFEAYRHNLNAIQQLNDDMLPFKRYIVDVEKTIRKPQYLTPLISYDMRPLMVPLDEKFLSCGGVTEYFYPPNIGTAAKSVPVLDDSTWPSASDLNLDNSQYRALKEAVTNELSIIQGPPGTGKTYIGLRIVQLLLHNLNEWFFNEGKAIPILIVCYTNHALDQFLEGLLLFTRKIVRIGGRGKNEAISKFQLKSLKRSYIQDRKFPLYLTSNTSIKKVQLEGLKSKIDDLNRLIENSVTTVLNESTLEKYIPSYQYESLKYDYFDHYYGRYFESSIYDWLSTSSLATLPTTDLPERRYESKNAIDVSHNEMDEVKSEDEADVEYIENERNIDFYDFEDSPVYKNVNYEDRVENEDSSGWQTQNSKKQRRKMMSNIKKRLELSEVMKEDVALKIVNVWELDIDKRWQLYKYWVQKYVEELRRKLLDLQGQLKNTFDQLAEMQTEEDLLILYSAHIVGMTTTGAAKYRHLIQRLNPVILIVEEAAEILESHIVTSLAPGTQHVILIGDQQQLRPSPCVYTLASKYDMDVSLFERMIKNGISYCKLSIQHRMRPDIADLIAPHIYTHLENHKAVTEFEDIKGIKKNVFFVSHSINEFQERDSKSKVNEHEARFLLKLCRYLIQQGYDPSQITILTTYSGQLFTLKHLASDVLKEVRMTVVDNFQGEENDIILLSFVRSNRDGEIGFLKVPNRVCVALSRAKKGLYCIGNFELLAEKSNLWNNIIDTLVQKQSTGPSLELFCQNHPNTSIPVATEADFATVSDGGCERNCEYRLDCGHVCPLRCHPYNHESVRCEKPCVKSCPNGHPCTKKCFQFCGSCRVMVNRTLVRCGHTINAVCGKDEDEIRCTFDCEEVLLCSHKCSNKCGEPCVEKCEEACNKVCEEGHPCKKKCFEICGSCDIQVERTFQRCGHTVIVSCGIDKISIICTFDCKKVLPCSHNCTNKCGEPCVINCDQLKKIVSPICGHTLNVPCYSVNNTGELINMDLEYKILNCAELCREVLSCGHACKGTCGNCSQGRLHIACNEPCERTLICGHKCTSICSKSCPPCWKPCENKCNHQTCSRKCFEPCIKCTKQCEWSCSHKTCTRLCSEICNREPCNEPCPKILSCGHPCTGFCGEPCPPGCEMCDGEKGTFAGENKISGSKNESCTRYILLEDCNHKILLQNIDDRMAFKLEGNLEIQLKTCPICKAVIRNNFRYGNVIKTCFIQIERVKRITLWDPETNVRLQNTLFRRVKDLSSRVQSRFYDSQSLHCAVSWKSLLEALSPKKNCNISELTAVENIINIFSHYRPFGKGKKNPSTPTSSKLSIESTRMFHRLQNFIQEFLLYASEYQLIQFSLEIHRFSLISMLLNYSVSHFHLPCQCPEFDTCGEHLLNNATLDANAVEECAANFEALTVKYGRDILLNFENICGMETSVDSLKKLPPLKGMNMSTGHWYQCTERHVYCIIPYGELTEKECYECLNRSSSSYSAYRKPHIPSNKEFLSESSSSLLFNRISSRYSSERFKDHFSTEPKRFSRQNYHRRPPRSSRTRGVSRNVNYTF